MSNIEITIVTLIYTLDAQILETILPLFILFILLPIMELVTFIKVGGNIGVLWTLFWIFFTGVAGITIIRLQGVATLLSVRERLNEGAIPAKELLKGFLLAMAGVLLVIPGLDRKSVV